MNVNNQSSPANYSFQLLHHLLIHLHAGAAQHGSTILMGTRGCVRLAEGKVDPVAFWAVFEVVAVMVSSESQVVKRVIFSKCYPESGCCCNGKWAEGWRLSC